MLDTLINIADFFTLEGLIKIIFQTDLFTTITDTLSINLFSSSGKFGSVLSLIRSLYDIIFPVAVMMLFIYFMISLIERCSNDTFTWEQLWKVFAMLVATKILIEHGFDLLERLFEIGLAITDSFAAIRGAGSEFALGEEQIADIVKDLNENMGWVMKFIRNILLWIALLIPALISFIMRIAVSVICYSRIAEIYVRAVFTPIALSDVFHGGLQSSGWRYLKSFMAICLQGATIIVIAIIYGQLMSALLQNYAQDGSFWAFYSISIAVQASAIALMFKSLNLTREIMGVA